MIDEYHLGPYGSFWHRFAIVDWRLAVALCKFEESWSIHLFCLWIRLWRPKVEPKEMMESWGFTYFEDSIHLNWRDACKIIYMPWMYDHCITEVMIDDGVFVRYDRFKKPSKDAPGIINETIEPVGRFRITAPYQYTLKSGIIQERIATVTVERRSWCWRGIPFKWLRWPSKVRTSIDVQFSDEVGEETGSWKGGCIGCGYELRPGEPPLDCLRRMEAERKF